MAKIYAPNKEYTGQSAGVSFLNGIAETENQYLLAWFEEHGYEVEGSGKNEECESASVPKSKRTKKEGE